MRLFMIVFVCQYGPVRAREQKPKPRILIVRFKVERPAIPHHHPDEFPRRHRGVASADDHPGALADLSRSKKMHIAPLNYRHHILRDGLLVLVGHFNFECLRENRLAGGVF